MGDVAIDLAKRLAAGDAIEDPAEREAAVLLGGQVGIRKDADTGALIVAWWLPDALAQQLALGDSYPGACKPEDLHVTLLYLGDPEAYDVDLVAAVTKIFTQWECSRPGAISGQGRFVGDPDSDIVFATVDCKYLHEMRHRIKDALSCQGGLNWAEFEKNDCHGFYPHVTLAYPPKGTMMPAPYAEPIPFEVQSVTVAAGPQRIDFNFAATLDAEAYPQAEYAAPYYCERGAELVSKAGRVVSGANLSKLKAAIAAMQAVVDAEETRGATDAAKAIEYADPGYQDDKQKRYPLDTEEHIRAAWGYIHQEDNQKAYSADDLAKVVAKIKAAMKRIGADVEDDGEAKKELEYTATVTKSQGEWKYTFGPLYAPERLDAHGEYADADDLQKALHAYVEATGGDRSINLQHDDSGSATIGKWVEVVAWPYESTVTITKAGEEPRDVTLPAGTVYMGVVWDPKAWDEGIKKGLLGGLSLGGRAVRVTEDSAPTSPMGDKLASRASMKAHEYGGDGKTCAVCGESMADGNHTAA